MSPAHSVALGAMVALAVSVVQDWTAPLALACASMILGLDALGIVGLSQLSAFRRVVDSKLAKVAHQRAAAARAEVMQRMSKDHRRELLQLEALVDALQVRLCRDGARVPCVPEILGACRLLLAAYVRLSILHGQARSYLRSVDRQQLSRRIAALEEACGAAADGVRAQAEHRLAVLCRRAELWDRTNDGLQLLNDRLSMISERIHLAYEQVSAPKRCADDEVHCRVAVADEEAQVLPCAEQVDPINGDGLRRSEPACRDYRNEPIKRA